jgi:hypothetical protein
MKVLVRFSICCHTSLCGCLQKRGFKMSTNQIYCAEVFRPNSEHQRQFKLSFEPVVREENPSKERPKFLVDVRVGTQEVKPFVFSWDTKYFRLSSKEYTFVFRKTISEVPSYEVCIDNHWAWVNRLGNQGFELLVSAYSAIRRPSRLSSYR